jgi:glycosyltransferase involved in cell wall biosynthesis
MKPLRVCIDARHIGSKAGGTEQLVFGLASGLSNLDDGDEQYYFLTSQEVDHLIKPYIHGSSQILYGSSPPVRPKWKQKVSSALPGAVGAWHELNFRLGRKPYKLPKSDGTIEAAQINIMHFTAQTGFITDIPSIYHPHDLQHLHFPEFFSRWVWAMREETYRALCVQSRMVAVASSWIKEDILKHYGLPGEKVQVIPFAPLLTAYPQPAVDDCHRVRSKLMLPETFAFYPAQTWPHKNHMRLLEALTILRDRHGLRVKLVCSGHLTDFYAQIEQRVRQLHLDDDVLFLGFVSPLELNCLYRLCRCVVIPSTFESWSFPIWEAFLGGAAVGCSNVTGMPSLAAGAALLFDPGKPEEIAEVVRSIWVDGRLREELSKRGKGRVEAFSWEFTARIFRAYYRRLADRDLTEEDRKSITATFLV